MINEPTPPKRLKNRIPIIIPIKGRVFFLIVGLRYSTRQGLPFSTRLVGKLGDAFPIHLARFGGFGKRVPGQGLVFRVCASGIMVCFWGMLLCARVEVDGVWGKRPRVIIGLHLLNGPAGTMRDVLS